MAQWGTFAWAMQGMGGGGHSVSGEGHFEAEEMEWETDQTQKGVGSIAVTQATSYTPFLAQATLYELLRFGPGKQLAQIQIAP